MNYDYASLGNSCQISSGCLLNNTKYFSPNFPLYNVYITKMTNYPAGSYPDVCNKKEDTKNHAIVSPDAEETEDTKKHAIVSPDTEETEDTKKHAIVSPDAEETEDTKKQETFTPYRSQSNYSKCCGRK